MQGLAHQAFSLQNWFGFKKSKVVGPTQYVLKWRPCTTAEQMKKWFEDQDAFAMPRWKTELHAKGWAEILKKKEKKRRTKWVEGLTW